MTAAEHVPLVAHVDLQVRAAQLVDEREVEDRVHAHDHVLGDGEGGVRGRVAVGKVDAVGEAGGHAQRVDQREQPALDVERGGVLNSKHNVEFSMSCSMNLNGMGRAWPVFANSRAWSCRGCPSSVAGWC